MNRLKSEIIDGAAWSPVAPFLARLKTLVSLTEAETQFVVSLQSAPQHYAVGTQVYTEGDQRLRSWIVASGWACRLRTLPDGRRQIISIFLPGDTIGVNEILHPAAQCSITAITELQLLGASKLLEALENPHSGMPNLAEAFAKEAIRQRAQQIDHILRLGRLTARERTAHLFLELHDRMKNAGQATDGRSPVPLTQSQFGEALGLSLVHVNRTMQQLRRDGLIELKSGWVSILDRERMELLCDFRTIKV